MMIDVLLNALVPIFAIMALGYFAGWIRDVDNHRVAELNGSWTFILILLGLTVGWATINIPSVAAHIGLERTRRALADLRQCERPGRRKRCTF